VPTVAVEWREVVPLDHNVAREQTDLGTQLSGAARVVAQLSHVLVLEGAIKAHAVAAVCECRCCALLGLVHIESRACNDNLRVGWPADGLREAEGGVARVGGRVQASPRAVVEDRSPMDIECAPSASDDLGTVDGQLL
jgi:hypothetical protein